MLGVENCVVDIEKNRVVVTGDFDQDKLFEKLQEKMRKIIKKDESIERYRCMHAHLRSEYEKELAKIDMLSDEYMLHKKNSDENLNGCTIL